MSSESRKPLNEHPDAEVPDAAAQDNATIKDLAAKDADANAVRGGALPPDGKPGTAYLVSPST